MGGHAQAQALPVVPSIAPSAPPIHVAAAPLCFNVEHLYIVGATRELGFLQSDIGRYAGTCIGIDQIKNISSQLTDDLVAHGYVTTRVRVPSQNLASGTLEFVVTPGIIHDIRFSKKAHTTWKDAYPTRPGDLLDERDLEQGLEQMQRVPSQDVHVAIAPASVPGQSDLIIDVKQSNPARIVWDVNDAGSSSTGKIQGSMTLDYDNALHANDLFHIALNTNVQGGSIGGGQRGDSFYYSIPAGYWTVEASTSRYTYSQTIAGIYSPYTLSGTSNSTSISAQKMVYRTQHAKTSLTVSLTTSDSHSYLDDAEIGVQRRNETYGEVQLERSWSDGRSSLDVSAGMRMGLPMLGTTPDYKVANAPTSAYTMEVVNATGSVPLTSHHILWQPQLSLQETNDAVLYPNDQFAIGNRYTVRGFDGSASLAAESGYFLRNDFVFPGPSTHQFYVAVDTGQVWGMSALTLAGKSLTGTAIGVKGKYHNMAYNVFSGIAIHAPAALYQTAQPAGGFDLQFQI